VNILTSLRAGHPMPATLALPQMITGAESRGYEYMMSVLRSLLPLRERIGIGSPAPFRSIL
jgi:hypothetical protein